MIEIPLTQGKVTLIDDEDWDLVNQYKWFACKSKSNTFYAVFHNLSKQSLYLHRLLLGLDFGDKRRGDHKNLNTLDNRRDNLRICNNQQNSYNRSIQTNSKSGLKGVYFFQNKWRARIVSKDLGYFDDPIDAAKAYDVAAVELFGEFAKTNQELGLISKKIEISP